MIHSLRSQLGRMICSLALVALAGCMGMRVAEQAPPGYSIAGVWQINAALSSDTQKVLAALQPKPRAGGRKARGQGRDAGERPTPEVINDPTTDLPPVDTSNGGRGSAGGLFASGAQNERNLYRPPIDIQTNALLGGEWLKIRQTDSEVSIDNAATSHSYTPGERSVVSVSSGVADQLAGWKGSDFRVYLRPQIGPTVEENYTLSPDGKQLHVKIEVGREGRNPPIKVTRTYDRSTRDPASFRQTLQEALPPTD